MSVFDEDIMEVINQGIKDDISDCTYDELFYTSWSPQLMKNNLKYTPIPECSIQALYAFAKCINEGCAKLLVEHSAFAYRRNNRFYSLAYHDKEAVLAYDKHDRKYRDEKENLIRTFNKIQKIQQQEIINEFLSGKASIFNHLERDIMDMRKHEHMLDQECKKTTQSQTKEAFIDLMLPRKAFRWSYEIKSFILNAFSLIEYTINCLLPFWEQENGEDWKSFISKCQRTNPNIKTWTDLYNPEKVNYRKRTHDNQDITTPAFINVVNIGLEVMDEKNPLKKLADRYKTLKRTYRNMLTHGELGTSFTYGLTLSQPSVTDLENDTIPLFDNIINLDWSSYMAVSEFMDGFLAFCEKEYPAYWAYIMSAQDIPVRPVEYFRYTGGDLEKTKDYTRYLSMIHVFRMHAYATDEKSGEISEKASREFLLQMVKLGYRPEEIKDLSSEEVFLKFLQEIVEIQDRLNIPDTLNIRAILEPDDEEDDIDEEEIRQMQLRNIHFFQRLYPDSFGKYTDEEMLDMPYEKVIEIMKNSHIDESNLTEEEMSFFEGLID